MAGSALPRRLSWLSGSVVELVTETTHAKSIVLEVSDWAGHRPGQHVDVRLTAPDGYQAQRSYSIASAPEDGYVVLTIERLADGEVSPYLFDELATGDELEFRGPIGGYFVWDQENEHPVLLLAGGSGIVPFRAMLRHCVAVKSAVPVRLVYSARSQGDVIYYDELLRLAAYEEVDIRFVLTREWPAGWPGHRGRIDRPLLDEVSWPPAEQPLIYVCGPNGFVETAAAALVQSGHDPKRVRTERFGPTGD
jgi:ferredoxin-NADP reductase